MRGLDSKHPADHTKAKIRCPKGERKYSECPWCSRQWHIYITQRAYLVATMHLFNSCTHIILPNKWITRILKRVLTNSHTRACSQRKIRHAVFNFHVNVLWFSKKRKTIVQFITKWLKEIWVWNIWRLEIFQLRAMFETSQIPLTVKEFELLTLNVQLSYLTH